MTSGGFRNITKRVEEEIVEEFISGKTTLELSDKYKLTHSIICEILDDYCVAPTRNFIRTLSEDEIEDFQSGMKTKDLERKHKTSISRINRELIKKGILTRTQEVEKKHQEIVDMYNRDVPIRDICIFHGMSKSAVNRAISKYVDRNRRQNSEEIKTRNKKIVSAYKKKVKISDIAEQFDLSESSIDRILKENNVKRLRGQQEESTGMIEMRSIVEEIQKRTQDADKYSRWAYQNGVSHEDSSYMFYEILYGRMSLEEGKAFDFQCLEDKPSVAANG